VAAVAVRMDEFLELLEPAELAAEVMVHAQHLLVVMELQTLAEAEAEVLL
jgi:hypothetical protein